MSDDANLPPALRFCIHCQNTVSPDEAVVICGQTVCANCKPFAVQQLREGIAPQNALPLAGLGIRFFAFLINIIIGYIAGLVLGLLAGQSLIEASGFGDSKEITPFDGLLIGVSLALDMIYSAIMVTRYGGTLGKLFTGLRIVRADGTALSWPRALGRTLAVYLSVLTCCTGHVIALFDSERRALHDHICGTRVIRARKNSASAAA